MLNEQFRNQLINNEITFKSFVNRKSYYRVTENLLPRKFDLHGKKLNLFEDGIDLNDQFVDTPEKTFLIRVQGDSMIGAGIDNGDILLVDRSKKPVHGNIVVASINNKLAVKRLHYSYKETMLLPENDNYLPIRPKESDSLKFWGVAIMVIKDMK